MALGRKRRARAARARTQKSRSFARPLWIEQLEDRRMLATFIVSSLGDLQLNDDDELETAPGTLRAAIEASNETDEADTIFFNENLTGTIQLQRTQDDFGPLTIEGSVDIVGLGARKLGVNAAAGSRVFIIDADGEDPFSVSIQGLTISGGTATGGDENSQGGAITNNQNLTLTEVVVQDSIATVGGGIYNTGNLTVNRSLIVNNTALTYGGGIQNGADSENGGTTDGPPAVTTINSSTISGNSANTTSGYGGGLFNRDGRMNVNNSTIVDNEAYLGSGIASYGNEPAEDEESDPPPPTIFTTISGSILYFNSNFLEGDPLPIDIDVVGMGEEDDEGNPTDLLPSINIDDLGTAGATGGNNLIFGLGAQVVSSMGDLPAGTDPGLISFEDPITLEIIPALDNYGGSTDSYHPDPLTSPVIDHIDMPGGGQFDQRGRFFVRSFEEGAMIPRRDIGAVEVQIGEFVVDVYDDEFNDGQYSSAQGVTTIGDFSVREALDFSAVNPGIDNITFNVVRDGQVDPTASPAPTILLNNGHLTVNHSVNIIGPDSFVMEIDGNDPSPVFGNGDRVMQIVNGDLSGTTDVLVRNLTLLGGDIAGSGGAIHNSANLTLERSTIRGSRATLDGGAIFHSAGNLNLISSTISGNNSSDDGAALYVDSTSGDVLISNTTISGNTSGDRGAGIFNRGGNTVIQFSTITNNSPGSTRGGGLWNHGGGHVEVFSSIISGNVFNFDVEAAPGNTVEVVSIGYNLVGAGNASFQFSSGTNDIITTNPGLAPLASTGGLTATHALLEQSQAVDGGDPTAVADMNGVPLNDQRGNPFKRIDTVSGIIDIGAYELQGVTFLVDNPGDTDNGNYSMGDVTLREAIKLSNLSAKPDFIEFDVILLGATINAGSLNITDSVEIIGLGSPNLTLVGSGTVFTVNDGNAGSFIDVNISRLGFFNRNIVSSENLSLDDIDIRGNVSSALTHQLGNLRIENSTITGNTTNASGGGINAQNANVAIYSTTLSGNSTSATGSHGGGIFLSNSTMYGYDVILTNNLTFAGAADGAGLYANNSDVELRFSVVSGNITSGANSDGAGIFGKNSDISLSYYSALALNTTFGTSSKGGAVYINGGSFTVSDNTNVILNKTLGQFSSGGVIASIGGDVTIMETNVSQNSTSGADAHGGAIYIQNGSLHVEDSAIFDNNTTGLRSDGGAIYSNTNLVDKQTTILNSTISGNSTQDRGGGIYNADGLTSIRHSTISNNSAPYFGFGAGVGSFGNTSTTRTDVRSSIIAGNISVLGGGLSSDVDRINGNFSDSFNSLGYNLIGNGITGAFSALSNDQFGIADPGLEPLGTSGNSTQFHALKTTSLAINRGNPADVAGVNGVPEFDQIGQARVQNGRIDIGAYESDFTPALAGDFNGDGIVSGRDFLMWQRGLSPNPLSSTDLTNWQDNYGNSAPTIVAALQVEEQEPESTLVSASISEVPVALSPLASPDVDDSPSTPTTSRSVQLGWGLPAMFVTEPEAASRAAIEPEALNAALNESAVVESPGYGTITENDFGDIAVSRGEEADSEEFAAADEVFDLIGSGAF
ncbi:beta strand repeat-containing protein [Bythopirellula goksoeyrii]|uniref:Probable pectate lyase C n=1 Tax=Bythopirellula goksoeyrii TaxID=1400387 RepID=A0A5B9QCK5_9BACT|nr:right-handed parallel beta-helix repeat-containing protein [Bythopirellula goksoeyrii]QEG34676.1 hypothetical protein Pr1d_19580 [Bythopirellula goksoeyrii]